MRNSIVIGCFQEDAEICRDGYAVVAIDVIRATTTAITAVAAGRRCFPVPSVEAALSLERQLPNALLAGEISGDLPQEFELNNSPAEIAAREDFDRPLILLSSSGTKLIHAARQCHSAYLACFRNCASREVRLFEEEFARFCEAQFATGADSGASALELALRAYDIGPGDDGKRPIAVNLRLASRFAALRT